MENVSSTLDKIRERILQQVRISHTGMTKSLLTEFSPAK